MASVVSLHRRSPSFVVDWVDAEPDWSAEPGGDADAENLAAELSEVVSDQIAQRTRSKPEPRVGPAKTPEWLAGEPSF
jgi:hypothetical protein